MSWVALGLSVAGAVVSETGRRKSAKTAKKERRTLLQFQLENARRRSRIADKLEEIATKLLEGKPLSGQEQNLIDSAKQVAQRGIEKARTGAVQTALGEQAATGFLRGGRTARQLRRLNVEAGEAQQNVELSREQAIQQAIARKQQLGIQTLGAAGQLSGQEQFQQFPSPISNQQAGGNILSTFGGGLLEFGAQQQSFALQKQFLDQQKQQVGAKQGAIPGFQGKLTGPELPISPFQ